MKHVAGSSRARSQARIRVRENASSDRIVGFTVVKER
jgi:hypothetical protein